MEVFWIWRSITAYVNQISEFVIILFMITVIKCSTLLTMMAGEHTILIATCNNQQLSSQLSRAKSYYRTASYISITQTICYEKYKSKSAIRTGDSMALGNQTISWSSDSKIRVKYTTLCQFSMANLKRYSVQWGAVSTHAVRYCLGRFQCPFATITQDACQRERIVEFNW